MPHFLDLPIEPTLGSILATAIGVAFVYLLVKWRKWKRDHPFGDLPPDEAGFYDPR